MDFTQSPASRHSLRRAHEDFVDGICGARKWAFLALLDIKMRYRRTFLGPLWITISTTTSFILMAMLFSAVIQNDIHRFLPYVGGGMIVWSFLSSVINEAPGIFISSQHIIDSVKQPLTTHVLRSVCRHGLIFLHNLAAYGVVCFVVDHAFDRHALLLLLSLPVLFFTSYFLALLLAMIGARFRDIAQMVGIATQILFFMTPIFWRQSDIPGGRKYWIFANPIYHLIEIVRAPLMGKPPSLLSFAVCGGLLILAGLSSYLVFLFFRRRIWYWL